LLITCANRFCFYRSELEKATEPELCCPSEPSGAKLNS
jgi:hypothetical protein